MAENQIPIGERMAAVETKLDIANHQLEQVNAKLDALSSTYVSQTQYLTDMHELDRRIAATAKLAGGQSVARNFFIAGISSVVTFLILYVLEDIIER